MFTGRFHCTCTCNCCSSGFTGIDQEYEMPSNPELRLHAGNMSVDECVQQVVKKLQQQVNTANQCDIFWSSTIKRYTVHIQCNLAYVLWQDSWHLCDFSMLFHISQRKQPLSWLLPCICENRSNIHKKTCSNLLSQGIHVHVFRKSLVKKNCNCRNSSVSKEEKMVCRYDG